ncbi:MAG: hypothetical protein AAF490_12400 [Chloroflexota bacterium]
MDIVRKNRRRLKVEKNIHTLDQDIKMLKRKVELLESQLKYEQLDIDQLERMSIENIFRSIIGTYERRLEKEKQELLDVQLKYQRSRVKLDLLNQAHDGLRLELLELANIQEIYDAVVNAKENELQNSGSDFAKLLNDFNEQIASLELDNESIDEALFVGYDAIPTIDQILQSLNLASKYDDRDRILFGTTYYDSYKYAHLNDAQGKMNQLSLKLHKYKSELADVTGFTGPIFDLTKVDIFLDFLFDTYFVDIAIQNKIHGSIQAADQLRTRIEKSIRRLEQLKIGNEEKIFNLAVKRTNLLESI